MTNIYNKNIKYPNGTLIDNWYEEDELKKRTGYTRNIPGYPYKLRNADPELRKSIPQDDTFKRVIGEKEPSKDYFTTNAEYGRNCQMNNERYQNNAVEEEKNPPKKNEIKDEPWQKYDPAVDLKSVYSTAYTPKKIQKDLGRRIMYDQFHDPIAADRPDRLFMAQHGVSRYPNILTPEEIAHYMATGEKDKLYQRNQEVTFWSTHLGNSNMYHSFTFPPNPFGKSHAFTQPVQLTKGPNCQNQYFPNTDVKYHIHP